VSASKPPTLELRGVSKRFGSVQALQEVDFEVRDGEVMALVGDNGAGKSTLVKCVAGIYPTDGGEILFDDKPVAIHGPTDASALGIEVVYQDLALCDNLDIVQNMFLGRERVRRRVLDEEDMETAARETLSSLRVTTVRSIRQPVASLSGGQRQSVAIAKAVLWDAKLVIMDEPTAALDARSEFEVFELFRELSDDRTAVLISHRFSSVRMADRILVLAEGRLEAAGTHEQLLAQGGRYAELFELQAAGYR